MSQVAESAEHWIELYGDRLYRQALPRVRDSATAEDLVQETLLAAWKAREKQTPVASEEAWMRTILRNKIADHYRQQARLAAATDPEELAALESKQFSHGGFCGPHWLSSTGPRAWGNAARSLQNREFWNVLQECMDKLAERVARLFHLREMDDCATDEICSTLDITQNHCFVLLHRARLALRRCLELNWFGRRKPRSRTL